MSLFDQMMNGGSNDRRRQWRKQQQARLGMATPPLYARALSKCREPAAAGADGGGAACWPRYRANPLARGARGPIDWDLQPEELDVGGGGGGLPPARRRRKRAQLQNMALFVAAIARPGDLVVDFCSGGGHQSLPIAHALRRANPPVRFLLVDCKPASVAIAARRIAALGLGATVRAVVGRIEDVREPFDVGMALHACGAASDIALDKCLEARASYVLAPCCVGKVNRALFAPAGAPLPAGPLAPLEYPRSASLRARLSTHECETSRPLERARASRMKPSLALSLSQRYRALAKAADYSKYREPTAAGDADDGDGADDDSDDGAHARPAAPRAAPAGVERQMRLCKSVLERDRNRRAEERGWSTWLYVMHPSSASPKNDVLVGVSPSASGAARRGALGVDEAIGVPWDL